MSLFSKLTGKNNADQLREQGKQLFQQGNVGAAMQTFQQALTVAQKHHDVKSEAYVRNSYGLALKDTDELRAAMQQFSVSLDLARQTKDTFLEAQVLGNLGITLRALGNLDAAIVYHQQSLELSQKTSNPFSFGSALQNLGNTYMEQGRYDLAVPLFRQRIQFATEVGNDVWLGRSNLSLGEALMAMGAFEQALDHFEQGEEILEDVPLPADQVRHYLVLMTECRNAIIEGRSSSANGSQSRSERVLPPPPNVHSVQPAPAETLTAMQVQELAQQGIAFVTNGDFGRGIPCLQRVLSYTRATNNHRQSIAALNIMADAYGQAGETDLLLQYGWEALDIARQAGLRDLEAAVLGNIGKGLAMNEQYEAALPYFSEHARVAQEQEDQKGYGIALSNLGQAYVATKQIKQGLEILEKAYQVVQYLEDREGQIQIISAMGSAYRTQGELKKAAELFSMQFRLSQEISDTQGSAIASLNSALVYDDAGQYKHALSLALQAERMFTQVNDIRHAQRARALVAEYQKKAR